MKLSELVGYLNLLDSVNLTAEHDPLAKKFYEINHVVANHAVQISERSQAFCHTVDQISQHFVHAQQSLDELRSAVCDQIATAEAAQYQTSQLLYEQEMIFETTDYILSRRMTIDADSAMLLKGRMLRYTDWRIPGMILRPAQEKFIEDLVPLDPLYLVDQHSDLLQPAIDAFNPGYQRRLRPYVINDYANNDPLWQLPRDQFGFVLAYNYFNYKPIAVMCRYLTSLFECLRPGGVAIFTFNDCDWAHGVALAESSLMTYTPGKVIRQHCHNTGFEITHYQRGTGNVAWMEIRKPGEIESIRGGQSLAKIVANQ